LPTAGARTVQLTSRSGRLAPVSGDVEPSSSREPPRPWFSERLPIVIRQEEAQMKRLGVVVTWFLQALLGVLFVLIGIAKYASPMWAESFGRWGYPTGFHLVVGVVEVGGGLALFVPRLATLAAGGLAVVMIGALGTHVVYAEWHRLGAPLVYLLLLAAVGWIRRRDLGHGRLRADAPAASTMVR
jgi:uncharacterized membrane protein YphA (DoxX/SURF4 family)